MNFMFFFRYGIILPILESLAEDLSLTATSNYASALSQTSGDIDMAIAISGTSYSGMLGNAESWSNRLERVLRGVIQSSTEKEEFSIEFVIRENGEVKSVPHKFVHGALSILRAGVRKVAQLTDNSSSVGNWTNLSDDEFQIAFNELSESLTRRWNLAKDRRTGVIILHTPKIEDIQPPFLYPIFYVSCFRKGVFGRIT